MCNAAARRHDCRKSREPRCYWSVDSTKAASDKRQSRLVGNGQNMITEFLDTSDDLAHDRFQDWRTSHQEGVFLTLLTRMRANLHGARCHHLGSGPPYFSSEDGFGSLTSKKKVCGSESELHAWAVAHEVTVTRCQHCVRDGLVGPAGQESIVSTDPPIGNKLTEEDFVSADDGRRGQASPRECI